MSRLLAHLLQTTALRDGEDGGGGGAGEGGQQQPAVERPGWAKNDAYWDDAAKSINADALTADLDELAGIRAERSERAKTVPEKAEGYEVKLPDSLKLPDKYELPFEKDDPQLARFRELAKARGMTQAEFSELLGFEVQRQLDEDKYLGELVDAEKKKLGDNAAGRITGAAQALEAAIGPEKAKALLGATFTAVQVEAIEDLLKLANGQTMPGLNSNGRQTETAKISQEDWDKLSDAEKLNYHRRAAA